jgi:hypothetical protein
LKNGEIGSGWLSKSVSWLWPAFKIGELALAGIQNQRVGSGRLSKSASWLWPTLKSAQRSSEKDLNLPVLKSFSQIQKHFALNG